MPIMGESKRVRSAGFERSRFLLVLRSHWDALAVFLLILATLPAVFLSPGTLVVVGTPNLLDDSWLLDISFKASRGIWLGRDVSFTYGPLFQWLSTLPARRMGISMRNVYGTWNTLPLWLGFLLLFFALRLLLKEQPAWKRFLLLLLLALFGFPFDLRVAVSIFLFSLFLRCWNTVAMGQISPVSFGVLAALLCTAAFLVSADAGVYGIAALLISLGGMLLGTRRWADARGPTLHAVLWFAVFFFLALIAVNSVIATAFDFRFWKNSLSIIEAFRWLQAAQMPKAGKAHIIAALVGCGLVFWVRRLLGNSEPHPPVTGSIEFLAAAFVFGALYLQSALVRSDLGHVAIGTFPFLFFTAVALFSFPPRWPSLVGVLLGLACCLSLCQLEPVFRPSRIVQLWGTIARPMLECPTGYRAFQHACFPAFDAQQFEKVAQFIQQASTEHDALVVFPYETIFGIASGRQVAGGLMQTYHASGPHLSKLHIDGLERASAPVGLYLPDGWLSLPIDGVSNFSRSPEVWFWVVRHYVSERELAPGIVGLTRRDARAGQLKVAADGVGLPPRMYPVDKRSVLLDLGQTSWPSRGADFLRLRLKVHYPVWWRLRKPERLQLEITRADGSQELRSFLVPPNQSSEVWFYPWAESELTRYFAPDEVDWRIGSRSAITHLRLWVTPLDWLSVVPESVTLEAADAVRFSLDAGPVDQKANEDNAVDRK